MPPIARPAKIYWTTACIPDSRRQARCEQPAAWTAKAALVPAGRGGLVRLVALAVDGLRDRQQFAVHPNRHLVVLRKNGVLALRVRRVERRVVVGNQALELDGVE